MNIILCNGCGHVFSRVSKACPKCTQSQFTFYKDTRDPELLARVSAITGKKMPANGIPAMIIVAVAAVLVGSLGTVWGVISGVNHSMAVVEPTQSTVNPSSYSLRNSNPSQNRSVATRPGAGTN